jgi:hypothetical protein
LAIGNGPLAISYSTGGITVTTQVKREAASTDSGVEEQQRSSFLTKVLRADGAFAILSGAIMILGSGEIAGLIELSAPIVLVALGVVLLGYGGFLLYFAGREPTNRLAAEAAIVLNLLWVAGSYGGLLLGLFPVNTAGKWAIAIVAEAVALFAILEIVALWRMRRAS